MALLAITNAILFTLLSGIHFYWMFGGKWGLDKALPTSETEGKQLLNPGPMASLGVALGMVSFSLYHVSLWIGFANGLPTVATKWVIWVIAGIFLFRAIGDFRYVGLFKKVKNTAFGKMDTKWYTPLCLYLGLSSLWIAWVINFAN